MAEVATKGLVRAKDIYQERDKRVRELKAEGKQVLGYMCIGPVQELITAADMVPYRIFGDMREPITDADTFIGATICAFVRSSLDVGLKGRYDFIEGVVFAHMCDEIHALADVWRQSIDMPYCFFLDTPSTVEERGLKQMKAHIEDFKTSLEQYTGKEITQVKIKEAIAAHNQQRALVRELYGLRKPDPPLMSGVETLQVIKSVMSLPVEEGSQLLREVISDVKERKDGPTKKKRLLVWGPVIDDISFMEMIEDLGANIVMDDTCVGSRAFWDDVEVSDDPLGDLAYHYLIDIKCPRTFREPEFGALSKDYSKDLEFRYEYLKSYANDWSADGAILEWVRYCDTHGYDAPSIRDYFDSLGLPHISLEQDYSEAALAPMRTRVQGLLEVIG